MLLDGCENKRLDFTYFILNRPAPLLLPGEESRTKDISSSNIAATISGYNRLDLLADVAVPVSLYVYFEPTDGTSGPAKRGRVAPMGDRDR